MASRRTPAAAAALAVAIAGLGAGAHWVERKAVQGQVGAAADPPTGECCLPAPPIVEFDPEGNFVAGWGGPSDEYEWPASNHGITVDPRDDIWIGGNGRNDGHILKFTREGRFLLQIGRPGMPIDSHSREYFGRVAKISFDATGEEAFVADGYGNRRVAVLDADTGELKRYWGAYGNPPQDVDLGPYDPDAPPAQQFRNPVHCAQPSNDGLVYVCDRPNDRIQVFRRDGTFVNEVFIAPRTLGTARPGTSPSRATRSRSTCISPTART